MLNIGSCIMIKCLLLLLYQGSRYASSSGGDSGGGNTLFMMLLAPVIALWNFLMSFLFGKPSQGITQSTQSDSSRQREEESPSSSTPQSTSENTRLRNRPKSWVIYLYTDKYSISWPYTGWWLVVVEYMYNVGSIYIS